MSAEVETMAYANATPWHGIGERVDDCISIDDMLDRSGLNWEVKKHQMHCTTDGGEQLKSDKYALVRGSDNKILTTCGPNWTPLQNRDAFEFFRKYTEAGNGKLETAGSLRGGKMIWALMKLPHGFDIGRGDHVAGYVLLSSPHQVGSAISVRTTAVRVVCANTMVKAMTMGRSQEYYRQNHLNEFDMEAARASVETAHQELSEQEAISRRLLNLKMTADDSVVFLAGQLQPELAANENREQILNQDNWSMNMKEAVRSLYHAPGATPGSAWGIMNAITHFTDHKAGRSAAARVHSAWFGKGQQLKMTAQKSLLELAA